MKLDIGCGKAKHEGAIGIDFCEEADVKHNLNDFPYPFEDGAFSEVYFNNSIEHLSNIPKLMEEVYRITKPNAKIFIHTPHFSSAGSFMDPTHKHHLSYFSFDYFDKTTNIGKKFGYYSRAIFKIAKRHITFHKIKRRLGIEWFANKYPTKYEAQFCWIFPAENLVFELIRQ